MNILEEFWYGNIEPTEYDTSPNKEYKETLQLRMPKRILNCMYRSWGKNVFSFS